MGLRRKWGENTSARRSNALSRRGVLKVVIALITLEGCNCLNYTRVIFFCHNIINLASPIFSKIPPSVKAHWGATGGCGGFGHWAGAALYTRYMGAAAFAFSHVGASVAAPGAIGGRPHAREKERAESLSASRPITLLLYAIQASCGLRCPGPSPWRRLRCQAWPAIWPALPPRVRC